VIGRPLNLALTGVSVRRADPSPRPFVLDDVTASFPFGSKTTLWGAAGGGKTTVLKCLAGLTAPTLGQVTWNESSPAVLSREARQAVQRRFGMVFQNDALFDSLSVVDNVVLPLRRRGASDRDNRQRAEELLARVGLLEAANKHPQELSFGMRKRVGVARAIACSPAVLFADDPLAGLDQRNAQSMAELLLEASTGATLIVALPDPSPLLPLDRTYRLDEGRLDESW
jgi:phospholipid/cholesterol/gamma-HCH transport system ATP-binding protein